MLKSLIEICQESKGNIILYIDEIHLLYGLGDSEGSHNVILNILKQYIEKGDIIIIGATTSKEYSETLMNDKAFTSRFDIVKIKELSNSENIEIIISYINKLETEYNIRFNFNEQERIILTEELIEIVKHQNILEKILPIRIIKRILLSSIANAIYYNREMVDIEGIIDAIKENNEIIIKDFNEYTFKLKERLKIKQNTKIIKFKKNRKLFFF